MYHLSVFAEFWLLSQFIFVTVDLLVRCNRQALCEEQQEDTMGLSSATFIGDEDSGEWQVNVNGGDTVEDREEIAELRVATSMVADRSFKETRKNSPMADGRTTPLTCIIRDVSVSSVSVWSWAGGRDKGLSSCRSV